MCGTLVQPVALPVEPVIPSVTTVQLGAVPPLNWSHFKPEFVGRPDEDADAHLLRTNDWMDTHAFPGGVKVKRYCTSYIGEARL